MNLNEIQQKLKAPKNQKNTFGGYMYRNCEDILEAVKPMLGSSVLTLTDEVVAIGNKNYVKATANFVELKDGKEIATVEVSAYAREAEEQKGMSPSQITGSASSYARKYALNGLFLIDDAKDDDTKEAPKPTKTPYQSAQDAIKATKNQAELEKVATRVKTSTTFTEKQKADLLVEVDFQAAELEL